MGGTLGTLMLGLLWIPAHVVHSPEEFIFLLNISANPNTFSPDNTDVKSFLHQEPQKG